MGMPMEVMQKVPQLIKDTEEMHHANSMKRRSADSDEGRRRCEAVSQM